MPADGEWRFLDLFTQFVRKEYNVSKQSQCVRSSFANGFMMSGAGYLIGYVYTYSPKKAFYMFGMPAFILTTFTTAALCSMNKAKAMKGDG